jgi:hypothetical protein
MFEFHSCIAPYKSISLNHPNPAHHLNMLGARIRQALQSLPSNPEPLVAARWEIGLATEVVCLHHICSVEAFLIRPSDGGHNARWHVSFT